MVFKVAVIGAGVCGIASLRRLSEKPELFEPTAFEQSPRYGGNWVYTDAPVEREQSQGYDVHSSIYKNLRTNLAKEGMHFPDHPFPDHLPSYMSHEHMLEYLDTFVHKLNLLKYMKFSRKVEEVRALPQADGEEKWQLTVLNLLDPKAPPEIHVFDAVVVCNGHYAVPRYPNDIPGMDTFKGSILHSHYYREPEGYAGQRVACLGGGVSGVDISVDIGAHATKVFWSHSDDPWKSVFPNNLEQTPPLSGIGAHSIKFRDAKTGVEREEQVDAIVLCTGYSLSFPFLHPSCGIELNSKGRIMSLYKHVVNIAHPSMVFVGFCTRLSGIPQYDTQAQFAIAAIGRTMQLPSQEEMMRDSEEDYARRLALRICHKKAHDLAWTEWEYHDELARLAGFEPLPQAKKTVCSLTFRYLKSDALTFRNINYKITDVNAREGFIGYRGSIVANGTVANDNVNGNIAIVNGH